MQPEILDALYRLIGEYGWNWGMARNLINRQFGTNYTIKELQRFYMRRPRPKPDTVFRSAHNGKSPARGMHRAPGIFPCSQVFWSIG